MSSKRKQFRLQIPYREKTKNIKCRRQIYRVLVIKENKTRNYKLLHEKHKYNKKLVEAGQREIRVNVVTTFETVLHNVYKNKIEKKIQLKINIFLLSVWSFMGFNSKQVLIK